MDASTAESKPAKKVKLAGKTSTLSKPKLIDDGADAKLTAFLEAQEKLVAEKLSPFDLSAIPLKSSTGGVLSMASSIKQLLKSGDQNLLTTCIIAAADKKVLHKSVEDLSGSEAFAWLQECEKILAQYPQRAVHCCDWIKTILGVHCRFLLTHPELRDQLHPLYNSLQQRMQCHASLLKLQGKLDLLLTIAKERRGGGTKNSGGASSTTTTQVEPLKVFREGCEPEEGSTESDEERSTGSDEDDSDLSMGDIDEDFDEDAMEAMLGGGV